MPLTIHLAGDETPDHVNRLMQAMYAYSAGHPLQVPESAAAAAGEATTKPSGRGKGKTQTAADAAPTDAGGTPAAGDTAGKEPEASKPGVPEVSVEQIRAKASEFNTDETRPHAIAILTEFGLKSVSASAELPAEKRAALLDALAAKLAKINAEAALA